MSASRFANTPEPPYFAVIFTSQRTDDDHGYGQMADRMMDLACEQPGYLGAESTRDASGLGITVSYWASLEAITQWKAHGDHREAQAEGKRSWYSHFEVRVCQVERAYRFDQ